MRRKPYRWKPIKGGMRGWRWKFWMLVADVMDWWRGGPPPRSGMLID